MACLRKSTVLAAVLGSATGVMAEAATLLTRSPYIQKVGLTHVTIMWRTSNQARQIVQYGEGVNYDLSYAEPQATTHHEATLTGLRPGIRYNYRLVEAGIVLAEGPEMYFQTDAGRGDDFFTFFVSADIGENETLNAHQHETAAMIIGQSPKAEFGLLAGDIVYPDGHSSDYDKNLMTPWRDLLINTCVWPALGNHDWQSNPERNFVVEWSLPGNEHWYSFDYGNAHFVALDSKNGNLHDEANQLAWLDQDLATNQRRATWNFVYFHHPMMTCTYKGHEPGLATALVPRFNQSGVDVVFTGHAHTYERLYPNLNGLPVNIDMDPHYVDPTGVIYIVSGCGGQFHRGEPTTFCGLNAFFLDERVLFTQVYVLGNAVLILTIDSISGELVDGITITKAPTTTQFGVAPPRPRLLQNIPNPFNPATTIAFEIPVEVLVRLDVYRADGRWIANLAQGVHVPGAYRVLWNGQDQWGNHVPSGIYIAKLRAGQLDSSVKMTLLR